jgi:apolipoprotein N-acyltransferase
MVLSLRFLLSFCHLDPFEAQDVPVFNYKTWQFWEWIHSSMHSSFCHYVEGNGQVQVPAALLSFDSILGLPQSLCRR